MVNDGGIRMKEEWGEDCVVRARYQPVVPKGSQGPGVMIFDDVFYGVGELLCHAMVYYKYKAAFHRKSIMQRYSHSANFRRKLTSVLPPVQTLLRIQTDPRPLR